MPLIFPTNPTPNQTYQSGSSATYQWNGSYWDTITPPTQIVLNATNAISSSYPAFILNSILYSPASSNYLGFQAGSGSTSANNSNFLGPNAGLNATNANNSNFIGNGAGQDARSANNSNFIGFAAGQNALSASYSTLLGFLAGASNIGTNNIIIGSGITLANGRRDSLNIGGLLFGTGSYLDTNTFGGGFSGSANGRIGINQPFPTFSLDVSGSGRYTNGLTITGSMILSGSTLITGSFAVSTGSGIEFQVLDNGVSIGNILTDRHAVTGSMFVSSSLTVSGSLNISGSLILNISGSITGSTINQPILVEAYNTSGQSIPNNSSVQITNWTNVFTQNAAQWNATAGTFTATRAGTYLVSLNVQYVASTGGLVGNQFNCAIAKNFQAISTAIMFVQNTTSISRNTGTCTAIINLAVGDVINLTTYQNSGGAVSLETGNTFLTTVAIQQIAGRIIN